MKDNKHIRLVIEVLQWFLIILLFGVCIHIYSKLKEQVEYSNKCEQFKQIQHDKTINMLVNENEMLIDSLSRANKDTVYIEKCVRIFDTIYDIQYVGFPDYDELVRCGLIEEK